MAPGSSSSATIAWVKPHEERISLSMSMNWIDVPSTCPKSPSKSPHTSNRGARAFGSLEAAEAKAGAFDRWVREKRSRLRELDLRFSEQQLEKTRLPERPIWADVDVDARRKKARERREGRHDPTPPPGTKGPSGPISRMDRY